MNVNSALSTPRAQSESPVVDRWNAYMKDVMVMELDPQTGAQPPMTEVLYMNH